VDLISKIPSITFQTPENKELVTLYVTTVFDSNGGEAGDGEIQFQARVRNHIANLTVC
jgi:hypothetical protein